MSRRRLLALCLLGAGATLSCTGSALAQDQTIKLDSYEAPSDGTAGPVTTSEALAAGQSYAVTVSGTWSAWNEHTWNRNDSGSTVCGAPEDRPVTPSPGRPVTKVGQD